MNKLHNIFLILFSLTILIYTGCSSDTSDNSGEDYLLAGYYMIAGDEIPLADDSRATAPVHQADYSTMTFDQWIAAPAFQITNYPERHQKTYITVTATAVADVYFVSSRTEYPNKGEIIDYYLEEYYVQDIEVGTDPAPHTWTNDDPVVDADGTPDPYYRKTMEVHFVDGSVRKEWIAAVHPDAAGAVDGKKVEYAAFDINGDLAYPANETDYVSDGTGQAWWSSKVYYYQKIVTPIGYFENENKEIFGVRYYTQIPDTIGDTSSKYKTSTLILEQTVTRTTAFWEDSDWGGLLDFVFGTGDYSAELAQTVIREAIDQQGRKKAVARSEINTKYDMTLTVDKSISYDLLDE